MSLVEFFTAWVAAAFVVGVLWAIAGWREVMK